MSKEDASGPFKDAEHDTYGNRGARATIERVFGEMFQAEDFELAAVVGRAVQTLDAREHNPSIGMLAEVLQRSYSEERLADLELPGDTMLESAFRTSASLMGYRPHEISPEGMREVQRSQLFPDRRLELFRDVDTGVLLARFEVDTHVADTTPSRDSEPF